MYKGVGHLVEAVAPLNWKQLERIGLSMWPVDSQGRFDERGNEYEFGNELAGIAGMRRVEVDPEKSFNYKITEYKTGVRDSRNLFTAATLKGGPVTPREIVDAYINANRALYGVNRELYQDIEAAKILGMDDTALGQNMVNRGERRSFEYLDEGVFRPLTISRDVQELFYTKAKDLGIPDPFQQAANAISQIMSTLAGASLEGDLFPELTNPFDTSVIPDVVGQVNKMIGNNPATAAAGAAPGFVGQGNINIDPASGLTAAEEIYFDPLEKLYRKQQRKPNQNQTKLT